MTYRQPGKRNVNPLIPPCRKPIYHTQAEAQDMIDYIRENRVSPVIRAYKCNVCGFWHLTSSSGEK